MALITLVTAPAGYGKSTLVSQWAEESGGRVAWASLGPESNNPNRFVSQLATAVGEVTSAVDLITPESGLGSVVAWCLDTLAQLDEPATIVVDDYHVVESREVHDVMSGLLGCLPASVHVVILSRTIPPLALGRLQAEGSVRHLTEADLRFTPEETAAVVGQHVPGQLTNAQVAELGARTEGWIAGIRLAIATTERLEPASAQSLIDTWPATRWLDDYIVEEVLATLPEDVSDFVLKTVILSELSPALCDAVLGIDTSARMLDEISTRLVFVRLAGATGDVLSYHALFAESVGRIADRTWPTSDRRERHRRAAAWYEAHGDLEAAVDQAIAAEDWEIAERCVRPLGKALMDSGRLHSRYFWLSKLPEDRLLADPDLARWYISALQYTGRMREAQRAFAVAGPKWEASGDPAQLGYAASARTMVAVMNGETDRALELAYEALRHYPADHAADRMNAWTAVIQFEFNRGNDEAAEHAYRQAALCRQQLPVEQWWWTFQVELERANQQALRGNLRAARDMCHEALEHLQTIYRVYEPRIRFLLAAIALEWNDLDEAVRQAECVARELEVLPLQNWHSDALLVAARVFEAAGIPDQASSLRGRLRDLHAQHGGERNLYRLEALEVVTWLQSGKLGMARAWAAHAHIVDQPWVRVFGDVDPRLSAVLVQIASGQHALAETRLRQLIERAEAGKRWAELVSLCVWHAVACVKLGDDDAALASLRTALQHGMRGGFVRAFMTPGYDLTPFLARVDHELDADEAAYAHRVLSGAGVPAAPADDTIRVAPVPESRALNALLSTRERQVLVLLRIGCTNPEIAQRLFITERTAKKHVSNILRKLDAPNRTAAVQRAVELVPEG